MYKKFRQEVIQWTADDSRLRASMNAITARVRSMNQRFNQLAGQARMAFVAMTAGLVGLVRIGEEVQHTLTEARLAAGATEAEFKRMEAVVLELARTMPRNADDIARALHQLTLAGFEVNTALGLLPGVVKLAVAAGGSVAESGESLIKIYKQFGEKVEDATYFIDQMLHITTKTNVNVKDLGYRMAQAGAFAKVMKLSFTEAAVATGLLSDVAGETAGILFRNLTSDLVKNAAALEKVNVRIYDAQGNFRKFVDILRDFEKAKAGAATEEEAAAILNTAGGKRGLLALEILLDQTSAKFAKLEESTRNAQGTLDTFMTELMKQAKNQRLAMVSAIQDMAINLFKELEPQLITFYNKVGDAARWVSANAETAATAFKAAFTFTAAIVGLGLLNTTIGIVITSIKLMTGAVVIATTALRVMWGVATGGLSIVVGGMIAWFVKMRLQTGSTLGAIKGMWYDWLTGLQKIWAILSSKWVAVGDWMQTSIQRSIRGIITLFYEMMAKIEGAFNAIKDIAPDWMGFEASTAAADRLAARLAESSSLVDDYNTRRETAAAKLNDKLVALETELQAKLAEIRANSGGDAGGDGGGGGAGAGESPLTPEQQDFADRAGDIADDPDPTEGGAGEGEGGAEGDEGTPSKRELLEFEKNRNEQLLNMRKERLEAEYNLEQDHLDAMKTLRNENASYMDKAEAARNTKQYKSAKSMHDTLLKMEQQGFDDLKALRKGLAIMNLGIDLATKPPEAYAKTSAAYPAPLGNILGIAHAALVAVQLTSALSKVQTMQRGGLVPGVSKGVDSVPALLEPGERVIPRSHADDVMDREARFWAEGGAGGEAKRIDITFELDGEVIAKRVIEYGTDQGAF